MPHFTSHQPGTICYVELATNNPDRACKFYQDLFGWGLNTMDMGPKGTYSQYLLDGKIVGAMYNLQPEQERQGVPSHWGTYFAVEDCDATTFLAAEMGGKVVAGPMDVADYGRMSIIADPAGAVFCIWQVNTKIGVEVKDEAKSFCWGELMTTDTAQAKEFYGRLFGWQATAMDMGEAGEYTIMGAAGQNPDVGMMAIDKSMGPIPPCWTNYFQATDCAAAEKQALELGADSIVPTTPIPGTGFFCILKDPTGAAFGLFQLQRS